MILASLPLQLFSYLPAELMVTGLLLRSLPIQYRFLPLIVNSVRSKGYWTAKARDSLALEKGKCPEANCRAFPKQHFLVSKSWLHYVYVKPAAKKPLIYKLVKIY